MALQIDMENTLKITIEGVDFFYKKRSATRIKRLILKSSNAGRIVNVLGGLNYGDNTELLIALSKEFMTGWEGLTFTHTNEVVPFSIDYIHILPDEVLAEFCTKAVLPQMKEVISNLVPEDRERKN